MRSSGDDLTAAIGRLHAAWKLGEDTLWTHQSMSWEVDPLGWAR